MNFIFGLICLTFAISVAIEKATHLIKCLKSKGSVKLKNGFQISLSVIPMDKKKENVQSTQNSKFNDVEE